MMDVTIDLSSDDSPSSESDSSSRDAHQHVQHRESIDLFRQQAADFQDQSMSYLQKTKDLEKASIEGEPFDLRAYFHDSSIAASKHGGKPKRMGVGVKNLTVIGQAPENSIIATNVSPLLWFFSLFTPSFWYETYRSVLTSSG
jgi:hypothetical protein